MMLGLVPLLVVILLDAGPAVALRRARSGTGARALAIGLAGCALMTPVVLAVARVPAFSDVLRARRLTVAARRRPDDGPGGDPGRVLLPRAS